jgi:glutaminyl-tRNA synthetase
LGYFAVDKDSSANKLVFNKTVGLKDAWEEKGKKESNVLMSAQKELNKFVKEKETTNADVLLSDIILKINSVDNFSLLCQSVIKNCKNDNNALLFANLILIHSDKVKPQDIDHAVLIKLYSMSLKSQLKVVRKLALKNLLDDTENISVLRNNLADMNEIEKDDDIRLLLQQFV